MNKPELITRSITGLFIGAISLFAIIYSPWTYLAWLCLIVFLGIREYLQLEQVPATWLQSSAIALLVSCIIAGTGYAFIHDSRPILILLCLPVLLTGRFLSEILFIKDIHQIARINTAVFSAVAYIGIPAICGCLFLSGTYHWPFVCIAVLLIWANDIGAYMIGSIWGKHKIAPAISPGKSIEGTLGGALLTLVTGYVLSRIWPDLSFAYIATLSLTTPLAALAGDLWESVLKRNAGVKDSGSLLPGHGGILDRYDSLLFVLPVAALAYFIFAV